MYKISWVLKKRKRELRHCILQLFQISPNYTAIGKTLQPWQRHVNVQSTSCRLAEAVVTVEVTPWP